MRTLRIALLALATVSGGFALQSCFSPQPVPECTVITGQEVTGVTNYAGILKTVNATAGCRDYKWVEVGMTRYRPLDAPDKMEVGFKASPLVDIAFGRHSQANIDAENDCSLGDECATCVAPSDPPDPDANVCMAVLEQVERVDPSDPERAKLVIRVPLSQYPDSAGVCRIDDSSTAADFEATTVQLVDGGTQAWPAHSIRMSWSNMRVLNNARVPASAWTANLLLEETDCTANYEVLGIWPLVQCESDADCSPVADVDAGRVAGSGISPDFKPRCDTSLADDRGKGLCVPTVDVMALK